MAKLKDWEKYGKMVRLPINDVDHKRAMIVASVNGWGLRWQIMQWVKEGLERDMPGGKLTVKV